MGAFRIGIGITIAVAGCVGLAMFTAFGQGAPAVPPSPELIQQYKDGSVNWSKGMVTALGIGIPPDGETGAKARIHARTAAIVDAERNLLKTLKGVNINADTLVENLMLKEDLIRQHVEGMIKGHKIISEKFNDDGTYEVLIAVGMYGDADKTVAKSVELGLHMSKIVSPPPPATPQTMALGDSQHGAVANGRALTASGPRPCTVPIRPTHARAYGDAPLTGTKPADANAGGPLNKDEQPYTGLVIDCRGKKVTPSMCPLVLYENGKDEAGRRYTFYPLADAGVDLVNEYGVAEYYKTADGAARAKRVGARPLVVPAITSEGSKNFKTNVVISDEAIDRVINENKRAKAADKADVKQGFLEKLNVAFVVD